MTDLEKVSERVINFVEKLGTNNSTTQDFKNIIATHVEATLTIFSLLLDEEINEIDPETLKKSKTSIKKSLENLEKSLQKLKKNDKIDSKVLEEYYKRSLKSQLLFYCYNGSFLDAETKLFPIIKGIKFDDSPAISECLKDVYLCALSYFTNSIGSSLFVSCNSNKKSIEQSLKTLKIEKDNEDIRKSFQRSLTRNGFISPYKYNKTSQDVINLFKVKPRFAFDKFIKIFTIRTGSKSKSGKFYDQITSLLNATVNTPLLFMDRFAKGVNLKVLKDLPPSFISSPPHAYENLVIDKLALCYLIPSEEIADEEEQEAEEEEEEEESKENSSYIQLISGNLRLKQPPVQIPEIRLFKLLKIETFDDKIPSDVSIRGTCSHPFYYEIEEEKPNEEEEAKEEEIKGELISKGCQLTLRKTFYNYIYDGLHPIEAQLSRILEFTALYNFSFIGTYREIYDKLFEEVDREENKKQIDIARSIICLMLFPETRIGLVQDSTDLFILSVFSELYKLLQSAKVTDSVTNVNDYLVPGKVRRVFQLAMDGIIPAVHQNIVKLADWTQEKKSSKDYDEPNSDENHSIYPFSAPIFLRQFILDPGLRRKCPVIYAYLRLHSRFCLTNRIPVIANMIHRIWEKYEEKVKDEIPKEDDNKDEDEDDEEKGDGTTFKDLGIEDEELNAFFDCWSGAASFVANNPMTMKARKRLEKTLELCKEEPEENETLASKIYVRPFLPYEPDSWPGLIVLESLSKAHNEFISILQQHSRIHSFNTNDKEFNKSKVMDTTIFGQFLIRSIRGHLGPDCIPIFNEEAEKYFVQQASLLPYYYILHPFINFSFKEDIAMNSKGIVLLYEERFDTIDLTEEQKKMLQIYIKEDDRTAGALLLFKKFMFAALDDRNSNGTLQSTTNLSTFIEKNQIQKTPIENESYSSLLIAKGKLKEDFKVGQFSKIYTFLSEPIDHCRKAFSLQEAVIKNVITKCEIKNSEIDNISLPDVSDYRPYFTVIPKVFADLLRKDKCNGSKEFTSLTPTKLIELWEKIDEKERMLIDKDEANALATIKKNDEGKNNNKLVTLIAYFNDAKVNYKW